mgnify:CR=1 FL=1
MSHSPTRRYTNTPKKSISAANLLGRDNTVFTPPALNLPKTASSASLSTSPYSRNHMHMSHRQQHLHDQINIATQSLDDLQIHNVPVLDSDTMYSNLTPMSSNVSLSTLEEASPMQPQVYINSGSEQGSKPYVNSFASLSNINLSSKRMDLLTEMKPEISDLLQAPPRIELPYGDTPFNYDSTTPISEYVRSTIAAVPSKANILKKSNIPLALIVKPYSSLYDFKTPVPMCTDDFIIKCRRCGAYLNPYVKFTPHSNQWRCNFCKLANNLPIMYSRDDINKSSDTVINNELYRDRVEVTNSVVEYTLHDPIDRSGITCLNYTFIIDVSHNTIKNGMLQKTVDTIRETLDRIPSYDNGSTISIICVNDALHFISIVADEISDEKNMSSCFTMYDIHDVDEAWLPVPPHRLRIPIVSHIRNIKHVLNSIPALFETGSGCFFALGPALESAFQILEDAGGKIVVTGATLPNIGLGKLKDRVTKRTGVNDIKSDFGLPSDTLHCQNEFYHQFPLKCLERGIAIDLFFASSDNYLDIATISNLPRAASGRMHYYPGIKVQNNQFDDVKYSIELYSTLTMDVSLDAVMKVHTSPGIAVSSAYGHIFEKSPGLFYCPIMPRDHTYVLDLTLSGDVTTDLACFQISVIYTLTSGERRLRVITLALPTISSMSELYNKSDQLAIAMYYSRQAADNMRLSSSETVRSNLKAELSKLLQSYTKEVIGPRLKNEAKNTFQISTSLKLLPLLSLSLLKSTGFQSAHIADDLRMGFISILETCSIPDFIKMIYPTIYPLHEMTVVAQPPKPINNSILNCNSGGIYLIDNTVDLVLWVDSHIDKDILNALFATDNIDDIVQGLNEIPEFPDSPFNCNVRAFLERLREKTQDSNVKYQSLYIFVGQKTPENGISPYCQNSSDFHGVVDSIIDSMIEDPNAQLGSYQQYIEELYSKIIDK